MNQRLRACFRIVVGVTVSLGTCTTSAQTEDQSREVAAENTAGIELTAYWIPFADSKYKFAEHWETLKKLKPAETLKTWTAEDLAVFLPPEGQEYGDVWNINVEKIIPLLKQFHVGATHRMHHGGPQGAYGVIAAENDRYRRIRTRAHAEFKLEDGSYTPSQFAGDLVIERATNRIVAFRLAVPPRRNNVDLNWRRQPPEGEKWVDKDGNEIPATATVIADIGYCERMELTGGNREHAKQIVWDREIRFAEADKRFRKEFYKFARIDWLPWEEAVQKSQQSGKPLHVVALFGPLDDESC